MGVVYGNASCNCGSYYLASICVEEEHNTYFPSGGYSHTGNTSPNNHNSNNFNVNDDASFKRTDSVDSTKPKGLPKKKTKNGCCTIF